MSKILVISTSLRAKSNSDILAERLIAGAKDAGHQVEQISLKGKTVGFCKGCLACHKTDAKLIGPSYKEVAAKYSASDVDMLAEKVQKGGKGVWGAIPMTPNKVTPEEAKQLVTWILSLK